MIKSQKWLSILMKITILMGIFSGQVSFQCKIVHWIAMEVSCITLGPLFFTSRAMYTYNLSAEL